MAATGALNASGALTITLLTLAALASLGGLYAETTGSPRRITISSVVLTGVALVGLYVGIASLTERPTQHSDGARSRLLPMALSDGDIAKVRNLSRHAADADPAVGAAGDRLQYRLRLHNTSGLELKSLWVRLNLRTFGTYGTLSASFASVTRVKAWPSDTATVNFADESQSLNLDRTKVRLVDARGELARRLPVGIDQAGVNVGDLARGETVILEAGLTIQELTPNYTRQIEGGDIARGRVGDHGPWVDPVLAGPGDHVAVLFRVHNAGPQIPVDVRARLPHGRGTYAVIKVTASSEQANPHSTSDTLKVNFRQGKQLHVRSRYDTTKVQTLFGHRDGCGARETRRAADGVTEGGISVGVVGYRDVQDDCSERTLFVWFEVEVSK